MELLALLALGVISSIGWVVTRECLGKWVDARTRLYFAPAVGTCACALVAYVAVVTRQIWGVRAFAFIALLAFLVSLFKRRSDAMADPDDRRLLRFTVFVLLCLYGMQISLFFLFRAIYPAPDEVWNVFNLTGVSPPDQMFAWHQAMFVSSHRQYPQDPFYEDMDFYDRPHLGGYVTLFFFQLFHLPLKEDHFSYPAAALRFYHCFWWLLNNLYLLGLAPLFRRLFGYRGAILAVASTALSSFFFLCNTGGWMKFAAAYPFLLAVYLFLIGKGPVLQAVLCAVSYYMHGSVLPFLAGFGLLQIFCLRCPIRPALAPLKDVAWFALVGVLLVGAWFVTVRWVGSKQPLLYYYLYDAGLTEAQTKPVAELAKAFYARHSWSSLSLFPLRNLVNSLVPVHLLAHFSGSFRVRASLATVDFASTIFAAQRFCVWAAVSLVTLPAVLVGLFRTLTLRYSGRVILSLYLVPTLIVALLYRIEWNFSLHIMCLYHTAVLFLWASFLRDRRLPVLSLGLGAIAMEGLVCVLFADLRFLPVDGVHVSQFTGPTLCYLAAYLALLAVIVTAACFELRHYPPAEQVVPVSTGNPWLIAGGKLLGGVAIVALTIAGYSLYCLRFY